MCASVCQKCACYVCKCVRSVHAVCASLCTVHDKSLLYIMHVMFHQQMVSLSGGCAMESKLPLSLCV